MGYINWEKVKADLEGSVNQLSEITKSDYDSFFKYGSLESFNNQYDACKYIISSLKERDIGGGQNYMLVNFEQYHGMSTLMVRLYPPGRGRTERDRMIDSFLQGFKVFKVRMGSSVKYEVMYAT